MGFNGTLESQRKYNIFQKYKIRGIKFSDFQDWCQIVELLKEDRGLSQKRLDQIIKIKSYFYVLRWIIEIVSQINHILSSNDH